MTALTQWMTYSIPAPDMSIPRRRAPALLDSRFVIAQAAGD
ncbi:hypothetical protein [Actinomadura sp. GTD37]